MPVVHAGQPSSRFPMTYSQFPATPLCISYPITTPLVLRSFSAGDLPVAAAAATPSDMSTEERSASMPHASDLSATGGEQTPAAGAYTNHILPHPL
jgi:hypothetical protein